MRIRETRTDQVVPKISIVCKHGGLERKCEICERDSVIGSLTDWLPITTAPKDGSFILLKNDQVGFPPYVGSWDGAECDGPQKGIKAWRAYCCHRFASPTHWRVIP